MVDSGLFDSGEFIHERSRNAIFRLMKNIRKRVRFPRNRSDVPKIYNRSKKKKSDCIISQEHAVSCRSLIIIMTYWVYLDSRYDLSARCSTRRNITQRRCETERFFFFFISKNTMLIFFRRYNRTNFSCLDSFYSDTPLSYGQTS